jgi:hypothetical protein
MKCNQQHIEKPWGWESIIQANEHYAFKQRMIQRQRRSRSVMEKPSTSCQTRFTVLRQGFILLT